MSGRPWGQAKPDPYRIRRTIIRELLIDWMLSLPAGVTPGEIVVRIRKGEPEEWAARRADNA